MRETKWEPRVPEGDKKVFEGSITLKIPAQDERYDLLDAVGIDINTKGEVQMTNSHLKTVSKTIREIKKYVLKVELKNLETGSEYKTFDDLRYDGSCEGVVAELCSKYWEGFKPSKN